MLVRRTRPALRPSPGPIIPLHSALPRTIQGYQSTAPPGRWPKLKSKLKPSPKAQSSIQQVHLN
jgi:hypothetical protein